MLLQEFQTTSSHHEFTRGRNHPLCSGPVPTDQTIRERKYLLFPFEYHVCLSHDFLGGPRRHRIRNPEGRFTFTFTSLSWFPWWLLCRWSQTWLSPGVAQEAANLPRTGRAQSCGSICSPPALRPISSLCLDFLWELGWTLQLPSDHGWGFKW